MYGVEEVAERRELPGPARRKWGQGILPTDHQGQASCSGGWTVGMRGQEWKREAWANTGRSITGWPDACPRCRMQCADSRVLAHVLGLTVPQEVQDLLVEWLEEGLAV